MEDPEWRARLQASIEDAKAGRIMSWRIASLPLPMWARRAISYLWDREARTVVRRALSSSKDVPSTAPAPSAPMEERGNADLSNVDRDASS